MRCRFVVPIGLVLILLLIALLSLGSAHADEKPHRIWGTPSAVEGLVIPNGWLQEAWLELAPQYPELTALDIALWEFAEGVTYAPIQVLQGFVRSESGCRVYTEADPLVTEDGSEADGFNMRCFRNPAKELHCQLIGDVTLPIEFSCIHDPTPEPIGTYFGVPEEIAGWNDVFTYYYQLFPDENEGDEPLPDTAAMLDEFAALAGDGSRVWFSGMLAVAVYPPDDSGYTGVEVFSAEPLGYYLYGRISDAAD